MDLIFAPLLLVLPFSGTWKENGHGAVAMVALIFAEYAYVTIPLVLFLGLGTILGLRLTNHERTISNPAQPGGEPGSENQNRAPPVGD